MEHSQILGNINLSIFWYSVIVIASVLVLLGFGGYILYTYYQGKSMSKFLWGRMKNWVDSNLTIFEVFGITNMVTLEYAHREVGDGYRLGETLKNKKDSVWNRITKNHKKEESIPDKANLIMPKSVYIVNGVKTIPLWDLHPRLHEDIIKGIDVLIGQGINTLQALEDTTDDVLKADTIFYKDYTYKSFLELYLSVKNKYDIKINTLDVVNFVEKNFDKNFRESIKAKDYNMAQKKKTDMIDSKLGWAAIIISIVIVGIRMLYITFYK